jgi:hypothetical protein
MEEMSGAAVSENDAYTTGMTITFNKESRLVMPLVTLRVYPAVIRSSPGRPSRQDLTLCKSIKSWRGMSTTH